MKITKQKLCKLGHCYATNAFDIGGRMKYLFAGEEDDPCYAYDAQDGTRSVIWEHPGGTMSLIPLPGRNGEFLAVKGFRPQFMAQDTYIAWVRPLNGGWDVKTIIKLPFIHRLDIFQEGCVTYILLCTLATSKKDPCDWSDPGKLWAGVLPDDLNKPIEISPIKEGLFKNHGYCRVNWNGKSMGMIACEQGLFLVTPPQKKEDKWAFELIIDRPVSDAAVADIDGDGELEIATIEPFHGSTYAINKKTPNGWEIVYKYKGDIDFGHTIWGGTLRGVPSFIGGGRQGAKELFYVQCESGSPLKFKTVVIDAGQGPCNAAVVNEKDRDVILCANRQTEEAVIYIATD